MKNVLLIKVFVAMVMAVIAGLLSQSNPLAIKLYEVIGKLFINALTLVVVPLVVSSVITGAAKMGSEDAFEKMGAKSFFYFFINSFTSALVGLLVVLLIAPGVSSTINTALLSKMTGCSQVGSLESNNIFEQFTQILYKIIPSNIFQAASEGQILGLIFFSLLFGFFISKIETEVGSIMLNFWKAIFQVMMKITHFIMRALPIGVFGLMAKVIATTGTESFSSFAWFFLTMTLAICIHLFIVLPLMLYFIGRINPYAYFKAMAPAIVTAFSTSSSAATLPVLIECVEKRVGVSNRIAGFTLPIGTSLNCAGTSIFGTVTVVYIAQSYGIVLGSGTLLTILLMSYLTSVGMAGIPSACLVSIVVILNAIGLPAEGVGLVLAVERLVDMMRTVLNVFGNSCSTALIATSEGERLLQ